MLFRHEGVGASPQYDVRAQYVPRQRSAQTNEATTITAAAGSQPARHIFQKF